MGHPETFSERDLSSGQGTIWIRMEKWTAFHLTGTVRGGQGYFSNGTFRERWYGDRERTQSEKSTGSLRKDLVSWDSAGHNQESCLYRDGAVSENLEG